MMAVHDFTEPKNGDGKIASKLRVTRANRIAAARIYVAASEKTGKPVPRYIAELAEEDSSASR